MMEILNLNFSLLGTGLSSGSSTSVDKTFRMVWVFFWGGGGQNTFSALPWYP